MEDSVRGRALVREAIQKRKVGHQRRGRFFALCFSRSQTPSLRKDFAASAQLPCLPYFQSGTRPSWWTCCTRKKSRLSGGACTWEPRGESIANTCRPGDEYIPETLGVAGRPKDRLAARTLQILHGFHDGLGREDGIRRGQARSGIKNSYLDKSPRTRGSGSAGRGAGCSRFGMLSKTVTRETRDVSARVALRLRFCGDVWRSMCCGKPRRSERPEVGRPHLVGKVTTNTCYTV